MSMIHIIYGILILGIVGVSYADYTVHIPDTMIRGEPYRGVIVSAQPVTGDTSFRFGVGGGDIILPDYVTIYTGKNHAIFDIIPIDSTILSGKVSSEITVIQPDGDILDIPVETYPGMDTISRLWIVGPGDSGVSCDEPVDTAIDDVAAAAAGGIFTEPTPNKEIHTRLSYISILLFLTDRYCTPVTAPQGGVSYIISSDDMDITFGNGENTITGTIPQGYNSAILDVIIEGDGIIYATGNNVSPDSIYISGDPADVELHLGIGPSLAMESSYVKWYIWLERNGIRYIPDTPLEVYLTTNNPVLASFEQSLVDSSGPLFSEIRPHRTFMIDGAASGVIYTGTPAVVGDMRLLAGDRDVEVHAHIPGIGAATAKFQVGMPGVIGSEFQVNTDQLQRCIEESGSLPDGFYSDVCNDMWYRLLIASHFFDIKEADNTPLDSTEETIEFLNDLFGGNNTDSGTALYGLVNSINEYSISDESTGGLAQDLTKLLEDYLQASDIILEPALDLGLTSEMLKRMPHDPPPNRLIIESYPGAPGVEHVIVSAMFEDGEFLLPVYLPHGIITLASDWGISHEPEIDIFGSNPRPNAPGTRATAAYIPVDVISDGTLSASLGGVGSDSIMISHLESDSNKRLHVSTLPGSGLRDIVGVISILDSDGLVTTHDGEVYVSAGQGASDVTMDEWRGGTGLVRGNIEGVGEIIVHAPGLGGGTALIMPARYETALDVWHPGIVHVAEEFPIYVHTLDIDGLPVRKVQVEVAGQVSAAGLGIQSDVAGIVPLIIEYDGMFHAGDIEAFLNKADVNIQVSTRDVVELQDTIIVNVDTGIIQDPFVSVSGGQLLFSGDNNRWEARADVTGQHVIDVTVSSPGWEEYIESWELRVSRLLDVQYNAYTISGMRVNADLTICGEQVAGGIIHRMEPAVCRVSVPPDISIDGVTYRLNTLDVDGEIIQADTAYNFDSNSMITATYQGVISVEGIAIYADGTSEEFLWERYAPGDIISITAEPRYDLWGLIWDRPARWEGLPSGYNRINDNTVSWIAASDQSVTIHYTRDITYVIVLGAAGLSVAAISLMRRRIPWLRFS